MIHCLKVAFFINVKTGFERALIVELFPLCFLLILRCSAVIRSEARSNLSSLHESYRAGKLIAKAVAVSAPLPCRISTAYSC